MKTTSLFVYVILALVFATTFAANGQAFDRFAKVDVIADRLWPKGNPSETYSYSHLPFCPHTETGQDLSKDVTGSRQVLVAYNLRFLAESDFSVLCARQLPAEDVAKFRDAAARDFSILFYIDNLSVAVPVGTAKEGKQFIYTHYNFYLKYNANHIIQVSILPDTNRVLDVTRGTGINVEFTYSVVWQQTQISQRPGSDTVVFPEEVEIQWFSIINSLILVVVLTSFLAIIMMRILKRDYEIYSREDADEESGWKLLHADVFRFPQNINLLAAILGNGVQLLSLAFSVLTLALIGAFYPDIGYRAMYTSVIVIYALTTGIAGYVSASFYKQLGGDRWVANVLLTVMLFAGPIFVAWAICNTIALVYASTAAFPFKTIVGILGLYFLVSFPLQLLGAITAKNFAQPFEAPTRSKVVPRQIPATAWYKSGPVQVLVAGFLPFSAIYIELYYVFTSMWSLTMYTPYPILFLVFVILVLVTSCITIAMIYLQLSQEDHEWWWRAVVCGGASSLFVYGYSFYFFAYESQMTGLLQTAFYFGYNTMICYGFFLMMATVGFYSSLAFVKQIFRSIKCD